MSLKILLVGPNPAWRRAVQDQFAQDPAFVAFLLRFVEAVDGVEGLEHFVKVRPNLVISDLRLARLDGLALCRAIRELPENESVPLALVTPPEAVGLDEEKLLRRASAELGIEVLRRPLNPRRMTARLLELLHEYRRQKPGESGNWLRYTREVPAVQVRPGQAEASAPASRGGAATSSRAASAAADKQRARAAPGSHPAPPPEIRDLAAANRAAPRSPTRGSQERGATPDREEVVLLPDESEVVLLPDESGVLEIEAEPLRPSQRAAATEATASGGSSMPPPPPAEEREPGTAAARTWPARLRESRSAPAPSPLAEGEAHRAAAATSSGSAGAELKRGLVLLRQNDLAGAMEAFRQATVIDPYRSEHHAYLGWAVFLSHGGGEGGAWAGRPHLVQALRLDGDSAVVRELAGRLELAAGNETAASEHLLRALALGDPPRLELFDTLRALLSRLGRFEELEEQYRLVLHRSRKGDPARLVRLWIDLSFLYQRQLKQPERARVALEAAARLAPDDPQVQAARNIVAGSALFRWQEVAEGHLQRRRAEPDSAAPLHDLFELHLAGGRADQALAAATILVHNGAANATEASHFEATRPSSMIWAAKSLSPELLAKARHSADSSTIEQIVALLAPVLTRLNPVDLASFGSGPHLRLAGVAMPQPLGRMLSYAGQMLQLPVPPLFLSQTLGRTMVPHPDLEPAIIVGDQVAIETREASVAFFAAGAMSSTSEGRRHAFGRRGTDLKIAFLAALSLHQPGARPPDVDGKIAAFERAILASDIDRGALGDLLDELLLSGQRLNLSEWMRAVHRTAARIGLLVCADLGAALAELAGNAAIAGDLEDYALSPDYAQARELLGTAATAP